MGADIPGAVPMRIPLGPGTPLRLDQTLDSGQVFRWRRGADDRWYGTLRGTGLAIAQEAGALVIETAGAPVSAGEVRTFLGLDDPLPRVREDLSWDPVLRRSFAECFGLRIVAQDPWEGLVAFICSSHNAVFRIHQMMGSLAQRFGDRLWVAGQAADTFPPPARLAELSLVDLAACRLGYRDAYVLEAARLAASGEVDPRALVEAPYEVAREMLLRVPGVGPKVADCILLMALHKKESAFPIDVWVRRAVLKHYRDSVRSVTGVDLAAEEKGLTDRQYRAIVAWARQVFAPHVGYAQTYLFFAAREGII